MTHREPPDVAVLAARLQRAWPTAMSPYMCALLAAELQRIERAQRRHAERCCSGADGGYVRPVKRAGATMAFEHDPAAEARAEKRIANRLALWHRRIEDYAGMRHGAGKTGGHLPGGQRPETEILGDPRGPVLLLRLPGDAEAVAV